MANKEKGVHLQLYRCLYILELYFDVLMDNLFNYLFIYTLLPALHIYLHLNKFKMYLFINFISFSPHPVNLLKLYK